ncbi:thymidine kinase [Candidatus Falkowbacteria bacterium RIFOXYD2_FULL_35_9]|uniref:Thymidine kinase n=1 Tax=Candidatus Falkowbacteria bacterium RIFOXYC2_FULL_36_12 TaxID=1798002 RepID=A0A1F5SYY6_9BACT|nr:MAG: thymidine kinase [Candidatus Falkowbacteria bacterium RIFOXYB2_FULL_35_7]OGF31924.1 MAG: thymidine kinase [Candidatus Falkowbacteria bacterium RIFOXYC2_FULL_36_12]OGF33803.1 MAG: thymidine kinase [Candidatus Falkowbacteria bacterium RIFOXYA2_FULL_35_8]OGF46318.1 MAG: thymidine kinase [Candidatus Falkowbacteria bacterium RIFOXYD2_FULL_35_9]
MFSGKTEELLRRMKRGQIANLKQKLFKPDKDTRYSANEIKTHDGLGMTAINIPAHQPAMIFNLIEPETEVIGIDEVQFFSPEIVQVCNQLADQGIRVIVAGLDLDFEANPFGPIAGLMATAEHVSKVRAVCEQCGEDANRSFRISHSQDTFQLGEKDNYKALCRSCYVKAINKK